MSCDRESVTSCQDRLAMSRTVRYWVQQRIGLVCQLLAGPTRLGVESGETDCGDDLLTRGRMHSRSESWAGRNCGEYLAGTRGGGQDNLGDARQNGQNGMAEL